MRLHCIRRTKLLGRERPPTEGVELTETDLNMKKIAKKMKKNNKNNSEPVTKRVTPLVYNSDMQKNKTNETGFGRHPLTKKDLRNMFKDFEITFNDKRVKVFASTIRRCSRNGLQATGEILSNGKWTTVSLEPHVASLKRIASSDFGVVQSVAKSLVRDFEAV